MGVGAVQTLVYGVAALASFLGRAPRRAFAYRRFVEGVGKVLWFPFIKPRFYGEARLPKSSAKPAVA